MPDIRTWIAGLDAATPAAGDSSLFIASGVAKKADLAALFTLSAGGAAGTVVAVVTSTAGVWPARPVADLVIWNAGDDLLAEEPAAAASGDLVILAKSVVESTDATRIVEITAAAYAALSPPVATTMYLVIG